MRTATVAILTALALSGVAVAQDSTGAEGRVAGDSNTSVSASASGASASHASNASAGAETDEAAATFAEGTELNATLSRPVDARRAEPGDEVTAVLSEDVRSDGQVVLRKGTRLVGRVTAAQPRDDGNGSGRAGSRLAIVFDKAVMRRGAELPINATIHALAAAESSVDAHSDFAASSAARSAGAARSSGGGLTGGAGGVLGGAAGVAGGATGAAHGSLGGIAGSASGAVSSSVHAAGTASGIAQGSAGAIGGLDAAGRLSSGSRGVFGLEGVDIASRTMGSAEGSVITSASRNVRLDGGTRMLLVTDTKLMPGVQ